MTIDARYERILASTYRLRKRGYHVIAKWECNREMHENPKMSDFLKNHTLIKSDLLDPRDAFFGGRTENIVIQRNYEYRENTLYVYSLYPYVLKTGAFRYSQLNIYIGKECSELIDKAPNINFDSVEDLVRYKVLPLRNLFHPILPYRVKEKLLFRFVSKLQQNIFADNVYSQSSRRA